MTSTNLNIKLIERITMLPFMNKAPRSVESIISDFTKVTDELQQRIDYDAQVVAENEAKRVEIEKETKRKLDEIAVATKAATESSERAMTIKDRILKLIA